MILETCLKDGEKGRLSLWFWLHYFVGLIFAIGRQNKRGESKRDRKLERESHTDRQTHKKRPIATEREKMGEMR